MTTAYVDENKANCSASKTVLCYKTIYNHWDQQSKPTEKQTFVSFIELLMLFLYPAFPHFKYTKAVHQGHRKHFQCMILVIFYQLV